ncbi:MAG: hypothetical protein ABH879_09145 [archaeon]
MKILGERLEESRGKGQEVFRQIAAADERVAHAFEVFKHGDPHGAARILGEAGAILRPLIPQWQEVQKLDEQIEQGFEAVDHMKGIIHQTVFSIDDFVKFYGHYHSKEELKKYLIGRGIKDRITLRIADYSMHGHLGLLKFEDSDFFVIIDEDTLKRYFNERREREGAHDITVHDLMEHAKHLNYSQHNGAGERDLNQLRGRWLRLGSVRIRIDRFEHGHLFLGNMPGIPVNEHFEAAVNQAFRQYGSERHHHAIIDLEKRFGEFRPFGARSIRETSRWNDHHLQSLPRFRHFSKEDVHTIEYYREMVHQRQGELAEEWLKAA